MPVYQQKWQTDANYERCARFLMENHEPAPAGVRQPQRPQPGARDGRGRGAAACPGDGYEVQMLTAWASRSSAPWSAAGNRVRVYTPYGAMLPGMAYLVRRLLENTSNESFLKASFTEQCPGRRPAARSRGGRSHVEPERRVPGPSAGDRGRACRRSATSRRPTSPGPRTGAAMRGALAEVRGQLGRSYPLVIGGEEVADARDDSPRSTRATSRAVVGRFPRASAEHAGAGRRRGRGGRSRRWSAHPAQERAAVLVRAAEIMRQRRFELAAWEVYECGKPWREADADVAEAIDFCEYYAREMLRLAEPRRRDVPGETNAIEHIARGVAVVIPPWNFPLAIPPA